MKTRYLIYTAIALSVFSCKKEDNNGEATTIDIIDISKLSKVSDNGEFIDAIESIEFIPLELTDEFLIGDVQKVMESDSSYYIYDLFDDDEKGRLSVTDKQGHFIRHISRTGNGPGEYVRLDAFTMSDSILYLYDGYSSIISRFDTHNNYLGKTDNVGLISVPDIAALSDNKSVLVMAMLYNYNKSIYDIINTETGEEKAIVHNPFDLSRSFAQMTGTVPMIMDKDSILPITMPLSPTVYAFNAKTQELTPFITIKCDEELPQPQEGEDFDEYKSKIDKNLIYQRFPISALKSGQWVLLKFYIGSVLWNTVKKTGYYTLNASSDEKSEVFPFLPYNIKGIGKDGSFIGVVTAGDMLDLLESVGHDMQFMPDAKIIEGLTEESNPILIRYKFKQ